MCCWGVWRGEGERGRETWSFIYILLSVSTFLDVLNEFLLSRVSKRIWRNENLLFCCVHFLCVQFTRKENWIKRINILLTDIPFFSCLKHVMLISSKTKNYISAKFSSKGFVAHIENCYINVFHRESLNLYFRFFGWNKIFFSSLLYWYIIKVFRSLLYSHFNKTELKVKAAQWILLTIAFLKSVASTDQNEL